MSPDGSDFLAITTVNARTVNIGNAGNSTLVSYEIKGNISIISQQFIYKMENNCLISALKHENKFCSRIY